MGRAIGATQPRAHASVGLATPCSVRFVVVLGVQSWYWNDDLAKKMAQAPVDRLLLVGALPAVQLVAALFGA